MKINKNTSKVYFKMLSFLNYALITGIIFMGTINVFLSVDYKNPDNQSKFAKVFMFLVPVIFIISIVGSKLFFKFKLVRLQDKSNLKIKMEGYKELLISRIAYLVLPAVLALIAVIKTNNIYYLLYVCLMVILMIIKRPTLKSAISDLELDQKEIAILKDPDSAIL